MIRSVYKGEKFSYSGTNIEGLGQNLGLFSRIAKGEDRCSVLRSWLGSAGGAKDRSWPGNEEAAFHEKLNDKDRDAMIANGDLNKVGNGKYKPRWKLRYAVNSGILDVKYTFKTLSDMGFHDIGLSKASGLQFPSFGYMMSFNATTLWETWWRSEDLYSRNHPMFGAIGEWLPGSVAGISLHPSTVGGQELIFWPRIPMNRLVVDYASAIQGTKRGDAAIAWKFVNTDQGDGTSATVLIRVLVPPSTKANLRLPPSATKVTMKVAEEFPDLYTAKEQADAKCEQKRRTGKYGFPYHYSYDLHKEEWTKVMVPSKIGTPCESYLWELDKLDENTEGGISWSSFDYEPMVLHKTITQSPLQAGLFEIEIQDWKFEDPLPDLPGYTNYEGDMGPYCEDPSEFVWDVNDAVHMM
uniref:Alpha-L-rhamnosidase six-hairpin glycosidase domain-containing protein n=2 Tax=Entomoneis paludosa TaxID=265537 RepID=A0A7S3DXN1_9STRA